MNSITMNTPTKLIAAPTLAYLLIACLLCTPNQAFDIYVDPKGDES
ncbi:hypothetical protein [Rhodopirellula baltica]|uniref:Uncharacterized protein n=1 Tax=Rhodopirellula baltica SWK14 TaxID=993516 RepID=L7CES6_RHOBT|nr:hypothetical protein [Rhodopirellula baltica]ELP32759.1 hypothetical protein RBSWK_03330 [Rhodopirellula baltica SWK14]